MPASPISGNTTPPVDSSSQLTKAGASIVSVSDPTTSNLAPLQASKLTINPTTSPKPTVHPSDPRIPAQNLTTDHILSATWNATNGWSAPSITTHQPLLINPTASCLHYATTCFEGMKLYRGYDGALRLFRPHLNAERFLKSAVRIALPAFEPEEFLKCLERFVAYEAAKWLPDTEEWRGRCIYLRPAMIGTGDKLGVQVPEEALLYVVMVYLPQSVGSPDEETSHPSSSLSQNEPGSTQEKNGANIVLSHGQKLLASRHDMIRAWPGGFGFAKVGANYGPTLVAQGEAKNRGYTQVLWLFGKENYVTEAGAANFFVLWKRKTADGQVVRELVTPPLDDGIILEGITRRSVLEWTREKYEKSGTLVVREERVRMEEIVEAIDEGRLEEAFAVGTAVFVGGISEIDFRGRELVLPLGRGELQNGGMAVELKKTLQDIMYGRIKHEWGHVVE